MKRLLFLIVSAVVCGCVMADESGVKKTNADPDREVMLAAKKAHDDKDYEKAMGLWQQLEDKKESNLWEIAVFGIGEVLKEQGKYDEAIKQYDKLFVSDENSPLPKSEVISNDIQKSDGKTQTAVCYMYKGEYQKAIKALKFADQVYHYQSLCGTCQTSREDVNPMYQGMCYENLKNYEIALHYYFKIAFGEFSYNTAVEFRVFDLYQSQGQLESLKKILDQVDKEYIERHIKKYGKDSVEAESFKKLMPTGRVRYYIKNSQRSIKNREKYHFNNFKNVYFPPLPEKVKLPDTLKDITDSNLKQQPIKIDTPEMILVLERAEIYGVSISQSQEIHIRLKDGSSFTGKYLQPQAGKYANDKELSDGYNLVMHIKKKRLLEDVKDWIIKRQ